MNVSYIVLQLTVPHERLMSEINFNLPTFIQRLEDRRDLLALRDRVRSDECGLGHLVLNVLRRNREPARDIINLAAAYELANVLFLTRVLLRVSEERRVAHDVEHVLVMYLPARQSPRQPFECVHCAAFLYVVVIFQRQGSFVRDLASLLPHLIVSDPQRCTRNGCGEVIDLNAVELRYRDLRLQLVGHRLSRQFAEYSVLERPQRPKRLS